MSTKERACTPSLLGGACGNGHPGAGSLSLQQHLAGRVGNSGFGGSIHPCSSRPRPLPDRQSSSASLETLLALLQAEGAKIEEDTEVSRAGGQTGGWAEVGAGRGVLSLTLHPCCFQNMAEKFLDGELPLDAFIDTYPSQRRLAHTRRVKIDKLQELVLKGQRLAPGPAPLRLPEPAAPLPYPAPEAGGVPSALPRRLPPPPPPVPAGRLAMPFPAAVGSPCPGLQCPPLPPRVGLPPPQGFSAHLVSPHPPALPQRPPPRPGFIL